MNNLDHLGGRGWRARWERVQEEGATGRGEAGPMWGKLAQENVPSGAVIRSPLVICCVYCVLPSCLYHLVITSSLSSSRGVPSTYSKEGWGVCVKLGAEYWVRQWVQSERVQEKVKQSKWGTGRQSTNWMNSEKWELRAISLPEIHKSLGKCKFHRVRSGGSRQ